ncbi:MAG: PilZ domain-containing protein [Acidobacteriaceae bacterium]|nr:PilZ domain-containing protein [Acidobacteriaceae bacterium]
MGLQSLVLCDDEEIVRQLRIILHDLGIGLLVCSEADQAIAELQRQKFELVVVDPQRFPDLPARVRSTPSNRTTLTCAVGERASDTKYDLAIPKPFAIEQAWRTLREARGLMDDEQQRYYREEMRTPVLVRWHDGGWLQAEGYNLSVSGMAIQAELPPAIGVSLSFSLGKDVLELGGEVAWTREGRSGVRFVNPPDFAKERLESWIAECRREHEFAFVRPFTGRRETLLRSLLGK